MPIYSGLAERLVMWRRWSSISARRASERDDAGEDRRRSSRALLYPRLDAKSRAGTINAYIHTLVSAVMQYVLGPKGAGGRLRNVFMWPEDAALIIAPRPTRSTRSSACTCAC